MAGDEGLKDASTIKHLSLNSYILLENNPKKRHVLIGKKIMFSIT